MLLEHQGRRPRVDPTAWVAPTASVCGDVVLGPESRVLFGAVIVGEGGPVEIGARTIVMENAVIRGTPRQPARIGESVLVGPRAYLSGCTVERDVFLAAGSTVFNGAVLGARAEVRINGVVHLRTRLAPGLDPGVDPDGLGPRAVDRSPEDSRRHRPDHHRSAHRSLLIEWAAPR